MRQNILLGKAGLYLQAMTVGTRFFVWTKRFRESGSFLDSPLAAP